ncbi:tape measure protein [Larkinella bovis]|uniref:Tape measure protein n=1 Tax=Larkinella bovis TaxID=683041 RepID=A0ABW0I3B5_9BACT
MNYDFIIRLQDLMSPALLRLSQQYSGTMSTMQRLTQRFQSGFSRVAQTVDQLKRKLNFTKEGQSIDSLRGKLDELTKRRDLMVGTGEIRKANREIESLERRMDKMQQLGRSSAGSGGSGGLLGGLKGLILGGAMVAGVGSVLGQGMKAESTKLAYEQFAGAQAEPLYASLNQFANVTPFTNSEIMEGGRTMLAAGFDVNKIVPLMTDIGNVSAGSGKNYGELIAAVSKIKQKGFVDGGELHQEFGGTPLMDVLKKQMGVNGEELFKKAEKHQIKYADLEKALHTMSSGDGIFAGMLDKISKTAEGKWSTFTGSFEYKLQQWGEKLNPMLGKLFDFGTKILDNFGPVEEAFGKLLSAFRPLWDTGKMILSLLSGIGGEGDTATKIINILAGAINALAYVVSAFTTPLGQLYLAGIAVFKMLGYLKVAMNALTIFMTSNPLTVWIVALGALVVGLKWAYDNVDWFRHSLIHLWEVGKSVFGNLGKAWDALKKGDFSGVGQALANGWNEGLANAEKKINAEKLAKTLAAQQAKANKKTGAPGLSANGTAPGASGADGKDLDKAAGLSSTVGGSKSSTINITINKLIEKSEIHVNHFQEGVEELEETMKDMLLRVLNSANSVAIP